MLIKKSHLDQYQPKKQLLEEFALFSIVKALDPDKYKITVFLSHKHGEREILKKVITMLNELGVFVYVDWQDDEMPNEASGETADRIKKMIKENRKFILLATNGTIASKWCNWELGFGDADKYHEHIAIMPIAEDDGSWKGNEYLQIYPSIQTDSNNKYSNYYVEFKGKKVNLIDWLKT